MLDPRPCVRYLLAVCKAGCDTDFDACKSVGEGGCKKPKKKCKKDCEVDPTLCPACEDNTISGFGTFWCEMNFDVAGFCAGDDGKSKCKKTCGHCG